MDKRFLLPLPSLIFACGVCSPLGAATPTLSESPIDFEADDLKQEQKTSIIRATGNVIAKQDNNILKADEATYDGKTNIINAKGNVVFIMEDGDILFSSEVMASDNLNKVSADNIEILLKSGAKIKGSKVEYVENDKTVMRDASYTPCNICEGIKTLWSINAENIEKNDKTETVTYTNAWLDIKGVPVLYTPYLSHPSPEVKRKTGLLFPSFFSNNYLGLSVNTPLFIDVDEHQSLTLTPMFTSKEGVLFKGDYQGRYEKGYLNLEGGITVMDSKQDVRGYIFSDLAYNINEVWRLKGDINYTSDDTFLRNYSIGDYEIPWLESKLQVEGFGERQYLAVGAGFFQELRYDVKDDFSPIVAPDLYYSYMGNPTSKGGYFTFDAYSAVITRGSDYDELHLAQGVQKINTLSSWQIPYIDGFGAVYNFNASLRLDGYSIQNYYVDEKENDFSGTKGRVFPMLSAEWRYPLMQSSSFGYQVLEPVVSAVFSPNGSNPDEIPNEDSLDFEFDDTNLFSNNRFVGYDRVESGSRVNYGVNWNIYANDMGSFSAFIGQSYSLTKNEQVLADAGLNEHWSDYVGKLAMSIPAFNTDISYRFRLGQSDLSPHKSELSFMTGPDWIRFGGYYLDMAEIITEYSTIPQREEVGLTLNTKLNKYWHANTWWKYDLEKDGGPIQWGFGVAYEDECFGVDLGIKREYAENPDYSDGTSVMLLFTLKTLGSFGASEF